MPKNLKGWIILIAVLVALYWAFRNFIQPRLASA